jgi:hypothetical protein
MRSSGATRLGEMPAIVAGVLTILLIACGAAHAEPYKRSLYMTAWADADHDCQDTRAEVLIIESTAPVTLDRRGCTVLSGRWVDPYTGAVITIARKLDIDHLVPLGEVHVSGGDRWSPAKKNTYANDLSDSNTLIAVSLGANRSKGDRDPAHWLPKNVSYRCTYVKEWLEVKKRWRLSLDALERSAIQTVMASCQ